MPLPNFGYVSDNIFRSGQPDEYGYRSLWAMGVKNILKLNNDGWSDENSRCTKAGIDLTTKPISQVLNSVDTIIDLAAQVKVLAIRKTLVHCEQGRDRTGLVVGAYRIIYEDWTVADADAERKAYGVEGLIQIADIDMEFVLAEIWNRHHAA